jgi:membrane associated rhomboid family serine protease
MLPASLVLGLWFVLQLFQGVASLGMPDDIGGVAFWAHIGGFVSGVVLGWIFRKPDNEYPVPQW